MTRRTGGMRSARQLVTATRHPRKPEQPPRDPHVQVTLTVTLLDDDREPLDSIEANLPVERAGWDRMTPRQRRLLLDRAARDYARQQTQVEWDIEDPGDARAALADIEPDQQWE